MEFDDERIFNKAKGFLSLLKFVGVVDQFDKSIELLKQFLLPTFPDMQIEPIKANVLQSTELSLQEKIDNIRKEISKDAYQKLYERNLLDLELYEFAKNILARKEIKITH